MNFLMVIMANGIARGRVRTTTTESRKMAAILQLISWPRHAHSVCSVPLWYWTSLLWSIVHVRYINILTWLRGFQVKIANFSIFFGPSIPKSSLPKVRFTLHWNYSQIFFIWRLDTMLVSFQAICRALEPSQTRMNQWMNMNYSSGNMCILQRPVARNADVEYEGQMFYNAQLA